jgi:hypothetical protein
LIEEERRGKSIELSESSSEDVDDEVTLNAEEDSDEDSDGSSSGGDVKDSSDHEEPLQRLTSSTEMFQKLAL